MKKKRFQNAKKSLSLPADETPVVLIDLSKLGSCYQSLLFGVKGILIYVFEFVIGLNCFTTQ
jgi:hypothetical protein